LANFFMRPDNYIRYLILAFYFLDFIHLYGDMDEAMKGDPNKKDFSYFACDVLTCCIYLACFVAIKIPNYECTIYGFAVVPWLFAWYKRRSQQELRFFCCTVLALRSSLFAGSGRLVVATRLHLGTSARSDRDAGPRCCVWLFRFGYYEHSAKATSERLFADASV